MIYALPMFFRDKNPGFKTGRDGLFQTLNHFHLNEPYPCHSICQMRPWKLWIAAFLLINVLANVNGFMNPMSRFASIAAMVEHRTFRIDPYVKANWTDDWARVTSPDGSQAYYSNKAPAPALVGVGLAVLLDTFLLSGAVTPEQRDEMRFKKRYVYLLVLSLLFQVIPFALCALLATKALAAAGLGASAIAFALLAMLFGNTSSMFMNTYFGHGFTAACMLAMVLALLRGRPALFGFFYGLALLSDYGFGVVAPAAALAVVVALGWRKLFRFALGGIVPGLLWVWYHQTCFGGPLEIANKFQNPVYRDVTSQSGNLWGIFFPWPRLSTAYELFLGSSRGFLWTQPWLLFVLAIIVFWIFRRRSQLSRAWLGIAALALLGFTGLVWVNCSFGAWHGGGAPGPRYISPILPLFGLLGGFVFERAAQKIRVILWLLLGVAMLLFVAAISSFIVIPPGPLWGVIFGHLVHHHSNTPLVRFAVFTFIISTTGVYCAKTVKLKLGSRQI